MHFQKPVSRALLCVSLALFALLVLPGKAAAQIKQPGAHPKYSVELDPHLVIGWGGWSPGPFDDDEGFGLGFRATIPIVEQGPIKKINNSMGIGFGGDFLFYDDDDCGYGYWRRFDYRYDCSGSSLILPVVLQWNFWLTKTVSVFGEPGLAVRHSWINVEYPCEFGTCDADDSDTDFVPFIFFAGGRFLLGDNIGITVRLGWPYLGVGASILL